MMENTSRKETDTKKTRHKKRVSIDENFVRSDPIVIFLVESGHVKVSLFVRESDIDLTIIFCVGYIARGVRVDTDFEIILKERKRKLQTHITREVLDQ